VASLDLSDMDLRGSISPSLGNLSFLRSLHLSGNALTGHIPPQLGELSLYYNGLEGNIPSQLGSCRNLTYVALSFNNRTGNIPREFGSLPHLQKLYLGENDLTAYEILRSCTMRRKGKTMTCMVMNKEIRGLKVVGLDMG
jgi:Leucine-rich repeat (LRR) protein